MKRYGKLIGVLLVLLLLLFAAGCGSSGDGDTDQSSETAASQEAESATEVDPGPGTQSSETTGAETFIGNWADGSVVLSIYMSKGVCYADVVWEDQDRHDVWSMECTYDEESGNLVYKNGVRFQNVEDDSGNVEGEEVYTDGTGSFSYSEGTITWQDDKEQAGKGLLFKEI